MCISTLPRDETYILSECLGLRRASSLPIPVIIVPRLLYGCPRQTSEVMFPPLSLSVDESNVTSVFSQEFARFVRGNLEIAGDTRLYEGQDNENQRQVLYTFITVAARWSSCIPYALKAAPSLLILALRNARIDLSAHADFWISCLCTLKVLPTLYRVSSQLKQHSAALIYTV